MTRLFIKAIQAVRQRSLSTLSRVTVAAVLERILYESKEKFPLLSPIVSDADGLHFNDFFEQVPSSKTEDLNNALEELLLEILEVFGKITAEILTKYLHQELMTVTNPNMSLVPESQSTQKTDTTTNRARK